ncbi:hypothetical protein VTK73DRAFT_9753 [Phialemonium thermophilum]|uniref:Myb/SANT-like domain-containing protein n=1 Tax=Phialemonium thermophilum TaxID=223376 RepID=A0ABR3W0J0_9PEZI
MSEEEFPLGSRADGSSARQSRGGKHRGPRFTWNPAYEQTFFRSLCESVQLGLREGSTFKAEAWDRAGRALVERHNAYANKSHLINKSDNARKKFRLWRSIREDPDFLYNPATKTVTASEEVWKRHIEKEPLSRSLKGRPFEYEDFYEILFPDVIGTGGAPKRATRLRRKDVSVDPEADESRTPTPGLADLAGNTPAYAKNGSAAPHHHHQQQQQQQQQPPLPTPSSSDPNNLSSTAPPSNIANSNAANTAPAAANNASIPHPNLPATTTPGAAAAADAAPQTTSLSSSSALTPPEESAPHSRKRFLPSDGALTRSAATPTYGKRRRTDSLQVQPSGWTQPVLPPAPAAQAVPPQQQQQQQHHPQQQLIPPQQPHQQQQTYDGGALAALAEALRSAKSRPGWPEQALDLFFREFADEDMDLQIKIAEKALTDENKAMVFCKMPMVLRKHWVKRLREVHNRVA